MNNFVNYFIEANLYLVCFYLLYQIILVRDKHFRFNRIFLLGGIFLSMMLPLLSFSIATENTLEGYIILPVVTITAAQTESVGFILKWWHIIGIIYLVGLTFYLFRLTWQMSLVIRKLPLLNSSREKKNGYTLVTTNGEIPTCSFFKYLFWDKSAQVDEDEKKQIFEHELAHIKQWHSIDVLLSELIRTIFWFNPVVHMIKTRVTEVHEYLADHHVTKDIGVDKYSQLLTMQIFKNFDFALSNNFHKSQVLKRIRMLKSTKSKSIWLNAGLLIPTLTLLITVLSCDVTEMNEISNSVGLDDRTVENLSDKSIVENANSEKKILTPNNKEIFTIVEDQPEPIGGMTPFYEYVQNNLKYPAKARKMGIEGKVFVQFVVDQDGKLTDVQSVKGIGGGCDEEAVRVIRESLPWNPGQQTGIKVNVRMILPITFKLG